MASTLTATSLRGQLSRTTPSFVVSALVPAALLILSASRCCSGLADTHRAVKITASAARIRTPSCLILLRMTDLLAYERFSTTGRGTGRRPCLSASTPGGSFFAADHREVIEVRLRVRLGPQAHLARFLERVVLHVQQLFAVQETLDVVAGLLDLEGVPFAGRDLHDLALKLLARAGHDLVNAEVILQRVHPGDVIV